jgi:hypothetical protein
MSEGAAPPVDNFVDNFVTILLYEHRGKPLENRAYLRSNVGGY